MELHEGHQRLLVKIKEEVLVLLRAGNRTETLVGLILATVAYLKHRGEEKADGQVNAFDFIDCLQFFAANVRKPVEDFTKNEQERSTLIAHFLEWLTSAFTAQFKEWRS